MIFKKMFISFISVLIISFSLMGIFLFTFLGNYVISEKEEVLVKAGERISKLTTELITTDYEDFETFFRLSSDIIAQNLNCDIFLSDYDGDVIFRTALKLKTMPVYSMPDDIVNSVNTGMNITKIGKLKGYKESVLIVGVPVKNNTNIVGGVYMITFIPELANLREDVISMYMFSLIAVFLLSVIIIFIYSKRVTDPVNALRKASKDISNGKYETRVKVYKDDEIGQLATEFNNMADSIAKSEEMRRSFISDVSHELRTPMTTITGFVQGVLDDTIPEEKKDMYLNIVLDESKRLSKLVSDLLDISRLESEEVKLELSKFDLNELIRLTIIGFENRFNEKLLTVNAVFENESEEVIAEKDSIKRVLTNLIDNAIKFCNHKGKIEIFTKRKGDKVFISVKNEGQGIEKEEQKTIFERFYKLDKSRSQNKNGVGLGLYIVKSIIVKHNEKIWINSEPGKYAEFVFTLKKSK